MRSESRRHWRKTSWVAGLLLFAVLPAETTAATAMHFVYPVGDGSTRPAWGATPNYITQDFANGAGHTGVDLGGGGTIRATAAGRVVWAYRSTATTGWGNAVRIEHQLPSGEIVYSQYGHMLDGSLLVTVNDEVQAGQAIGTMGTTGYSTGVHLHFEVKKINYNGCGYIPGTNCSGTPSDLWENYYDPLQFVADRTSLRVAAGDWNGDGVDDVWRFQGGAWTILRTNGTTLATIPAMGLPGDWPVVGDFNGDGQEDYGVFRPGDNPSRFYLDLNRNGGADWTPALKNRYPQDLPVVGDWDGDGDDDLGAWDSDTGIFWLFILTGPGTLQDFASIPMGIPGDLPIAGNWDASGGDEVGVFRKSDPNPSTNTFYFRKSDDTRVSLASLGVTTGWGDIGDLPAVGDWNGDGYDTIGLYRPSNQTPYVRDDLPRFGASASAPAVLTDPATGVGATYATLNGSVNPNGASTTAYFRYGLTTGYGSTTSSQSKGSGTTSSTFQASIGGLACNTLYHFKAVASNAAGERSGVDRTFTTGSCPASPTIEITNPVSGHSWAVGTQKTITWSAMSLSSSAVVGLWFHDGTDFFHIADVPPTQTSYTWTLQPTAKTQGQVYIWSRANNATEADDWSGFFTITPATASPSLRITSPSGGEVWAGGSQRTITWTAANLSASALLGLWYHDGAAWNKIADVPRTQTSYTWTVPKRTVTAQLYMWSRVDGATEAEDWADGTISLAGGSLGDFGGDGRADILWRHTGGALYLWQMNGTALAQSSYVPPISTAWQVKGVADFSGDGKADILWRESASGSTYVWTMNGATLTAGAYTGSQADNSWTIQGTGDFSGDGKADILWRHSGGALYVWQMNGPAIATSSYLPPISLAWSIKGLGDFNGDGKTDVLWREAASGSTYLWLMSGATAIGTGYTGSQADNSWTIQGTGDFDGDGRSDILWRHSGGALYVWLMNGTAIASSTYLPPISTAWQVRQLADFNGDGKTDILWRETASGSSYLWMMNGAAAVGAGYTASQADSSWVVQRP